MPSPGEAQAQAQAQEFSSVAKLTTIFVLPMVLKTVIELDLLEFIARAGPNAQLSSSQLASQLSTQNATKTPIMLDRMLRLLASHSVLTCSTSLLENGDRERLYGLAPLSKHFLKGEDGVPLFSPDLLLDRALVESWYHLKDAILDGEVPFIKAHGVPIYKYASSNPQFNQVFNASMFKRTSMFIIAFLEKYNGFEGMNVVIDVGGGIGTLISMITSKYPTIKGINFDLPHVIQNAQSYQGVEHVGGDMFASVPKGDAITMKAILHNWSDELCLTILDNCYKALPEKGKVIVMESIVPTDFESNDAARAYFQIDLIMMVQQDGGKVRTEMEFSTLAKKSGFKSFKVLFSVNNVCVMEFVK